MERGRLLLAVELLAKHATMDNQTLVNELSRSGFSSLEAHLLVTLVPMAFSRPLLERAGIIDFSPHIVAGTRSGSVVEIPLVKLPLYGDALALAREHYRSGILDQEDFKRITLRSAEVNALSRALNEGEDVSGASIASVIIWPRAEDLGYEPQSAIIAKSEVGADGVKPCISCGKRIPKSYTKCLHCYASQP